MYFLLRKVSKLHVNMRKRRMLLETNTEAVMDKDIIKCISFQVWISLK